MQKKLYSAHGEFIIDINQYNNNDSNTFLKMFDLPLLSPSNNIEHFSQELRYLKGPQSTLPNNSNDCITYCGKPGIYLCKRPFIHSHDDIVNGKTVRKQYNASCGHCVSKPDVYYVDKPLYELISSNLPQKN